ncbi:3'-5' RNA helicase YTHDC2-like isoform X2 [Dreissena polymorpha]|uniref:3'-5' RNA helicase YTHDC2-like isoform X2 n=1 Tax=Dreissena polymorpha TaxID=45954 RepID=UPI002263D651|nr:3'-5' RNA helicase YTHDC2-like isoform X2 [Dreissena polymorpha]
MPGKPNQRPSSAGGRSSGQGSRGGRMPDWGLRPTQGPKLHEDACISEEVKIGINLAIERFRMNEQQKELEFPSSLTATERAYIHRRAEELGLKHKSRGQNASRHLVLAKKEGTKADIRSAVLQLVRSSKFQIANLLQRFPLTSKEKLELLPNMDKAMVNEVSKELARTATGRLNNGLPQVPPGRGSSELSSFTQALPVNRYRDTILDTIRNSQVCMVSGETGSGKTTQVPQMILDDCHRTGTQCRIFCTQPRRIAALSVSERVAAERGESIGQTVGFQIRLESRVSPKTLLTFCTNGVLLRTLMGGESTMDTVTHVIVDEVHERDKFCDFLLITLRDIAQRNSRLKIILMSATLNIDLFVKYFYNCPVVSVPGNLFPVEEHFLEEVLTWTGYTNKKMQKYRAEMSKKAEKEARLSDWVDPRVDVRRERLRQKYGSQEEEEGEQADKVSDNRNSVLKQLAQLGSCHVEKGEEELEPWVRAEMDRCMTEIWLTGDAELFSQLFYFISSENVSVDYQHSETSVTALMIAGGRGFPAVVDQLLSLEADPDIKSSNGWTALDWARKFNQEEVIALLEANMLVSKTDRGNQGDPLEEEEEGQGMSEEQKELLTTYQHCWNDDKVDMDLIVALLRMIVTTKPEGAVLIFLPGYDEIVSLRSRIEDDDSIANVRYSLYCLHSAMQTSDQRKVFRPAEHGVRKIILATNIAETSITINDVVYVINSGKVKEKTFDSLLQVTMLKSNWISKASTAQRKGRAGRCRPGVCYHMFSRVRYSHMCDYPTAEILRCPLQELCLQTKLLAPANENIEDFLSRAPEPPPYLVTRAALNILKLMDALDGGQELTELGRHLADLPVEPHLGKMVLHSIVLKCLDPILTIVCAISYKDPFLLPAWASEKMAVKGIRKDFSANTFSDHMALLRVFQAWQKARTDGWERSFCDKNYVSPAVMEMIVGMRAQLLGQLRASGFVRARGGGDIRDLNTNSENWAVVKAALCAGAYPNIVRWDQQAKKLIGQSSGKIGVHKSSVLPTEPRSLPSDWLLYEEMTQAGQGSSYTSLACIRCCTLVSPITVALFAGPAKLPADAVKDNLSDLEGCGPGESSDSENEDPDDNKTYLLQLSDWLAFRVDPESVGLGVQLRQKWQGLFLRRMRAPSKPMAPGDEAIISTLVTVLINEEQALGLQQPAAAESIMSGGGRGQGSVHEVQGDMSRHRFSTSAKKATSTPPKRKDFMSPKLSQSSSGSAVASPVSSVGTPSSSPQGVPAGAGRFFVMKCSSPRNIDMSVNKGAWATSKTNEKRLNKAFQEGHIVYLIFSLQGSGHFQGYAKMSSIIGTEKSYDYNGQGGVFSVDWVKRANLPFQMTHHLLNPWNENKRVQISRDGQEIEPSVGEALIHLWDRFPDNSGDHTLSEDPGVGWMGETGAARGHYTQGYNRHDYNEGQDYGEEQVYQDQYWGGYQNSQRGRPWQPRGQGHMYQGHYGYQGHMMVLPRDGQNYKQQGYFQHRK